MGALIIGRNLAPDRWNWPEADTPLPAAGPVVVPLARWAAEREALCARSDLLGVVLDPADDPAGLVADFGRLALIAIRFPQFTDGRGYSIARLLRERHGWRGELRAIGDVQRDQLGFLARVGFDAFALKAGQDIDAALAAFGDFSESYQAAVDRAQPLFRRRAQNQAA